MPGSGKTTLGQELADRLNLGFYDLDGLIENQTGHTVNLIFEKFGEEYFRKVETEVLDYFLDGKKYFVLASGGGTPCFNGNMDKMNAAASTVFLDVEEEELVRRLSSASNFGRPLLQEKNIEEKIKNTLNDRKVFYELAKYQINGNQINANAVVSLLEKETNSK